MKNIRHKKNCSIKKNNMYEYILYYLFINKKNEIK